MDFSPGPPRSLISVRIKAVLFFAAISAAVTAGYVYRSQDRYRHVAVHEPGRMYRAAWVEPDVLSELIQRNGIRTVVNLCSPGETGEHRWALERETVRRAGARLLELPMPVDAAPDDPRLDLHLAALADADNFPMLVHCQQGVTRTSKFLAIYDIRFRGKTAEETLAVQPHFGRPKHDVAVEAFCRAFEKHNATLALDATASRLDVLGH